MFVEFFFQGFKNLTSLTELDLSDNNIVALPPELVSIWNFSLYFELLVIEKSWLILCKMASVTAVTQKE